ncbi:MAG: hypothetical protein LAT82_05780 [Nanoarchaeota archaeon]|nr:hypothetical protein [Nanoarchaeota archaeon]
MKLINLIKSSSNVLIVSFLLLLTISTIYAQVGSTGLTRSMGDVDMAYSEPAVEPMVADNMGSQGVEDSRIMPGFWGCSFDFTTLSQNDVEKIRALEKESQELSNQANDIRTNAQDRYNEIYESIFRIDDNRNDLDYFNEFSEEKWNQYYEQIEELELRLGLTQRYEQIEQIQEELQDYFDGCYNPYNEEWIVFKLSDDEKERYQELQDALTQSYEEENTLYQGNARDYDRIYQESRDESQRLEESLGITQLQEQIRELQQQINSIRNENAQDFNSIWENQREEIEQLEQSSGLKQIREEREDIFKEIQELTGTQNYYGYPIMYARDAGMDGIEVPSSEMSEFNRGDDRLDITGSAIPREMNIQTTSQGLNYKSTCENNGGNWLEEFSQCEFSNKAVCEQMGGEFIECGSACRNDPNAEICTMQCVPYCDLKNVISREDSNTQEPVLNNDDNKIGLEEKEDRGIFKRIRSFFTSLFTN